MKCVKCGSTNIEVAVFGFSYTQYVCGHCYCMFRVWEKVINGRKVSEFQIL